MNPASAVKAADVEPPETGKAVRMEPQPIPLPARISRVANTPTVSKPRTTTGKREERRISAPPSTRNASVAGPPSSSSSAGGVRAKTSSLEHHSTATASSAVAAISISPRPGGNQVMKTRGKSVVAKEDAAARRERQSVTPAGGAGAIDKDVSAFPQKKGGNRLICSAEQFIGDDEANCDRVGDAPVKEPEQRVHHSDQRQDGMDVVLRDSHVGDKAVSETEKWLEWDPAARDSRAAAISRRIWGGSQTPHDKDAGCGTCGCETSWGRKLGTSGHDPAREADIGGADTAVAKSVDRRRQHVCNGRLQQPEGNSIASDATGRPCSKGGTTRSAAFGNVVGAIPSDEVATSPDRSRGNSMTGRQQRSKAFGGLSSPAAAPVAATNYPGGCVGLEGGNNIVESVDTDQTKGPKCLEAKTLSFDDFHFSMTASGSNFQLQGNVSEEKPHQFQRLLPLGVEPHAAEHSCAIGGIARNNSEGVDIVQSSNAQDRKCKRIDAHRSVWLMSPCRSTMSGYSVAAEFFSDPFERGAASDLLPVAHREVGMTPSAFS